MRIENENREKVDILLEKKMRVLQLVACSPLLYLYYNVDCGSAAVLIINYEPNMG